MKKNNLKRFLASLLAVLMLASVTGVSPAVFAEAADNTATYEANATPQLKADVIDNTTWVVIPENASMDQLKQILASTLLENAEEVDAQNVPWLYKSKVYGTNDKTGITIYPKSNEDFVTIDGIDIPGGTYIGAKFTYKHPAFNTQGIGEYDLQLNGVTIKIHKDIKNSSSITLTGYENGIKVPYNKDGSINYAQLKERILDKVVTNPETAKSNITIEYMAAIDMGKASEIPSIETIADWLANAGKEWTPIEGGTHKHVFDIPYLAMTAGENTIRLSWGGDDTYYGCTSSEFTVNFLDREAAPLQRNEVSEIGIVYKEDLSVDYEATMDVIRNTLATSTDTEIVKTSDLKVEYQAYNGYNDFGSDADIQPGTEKTIRLSWNGNADYSAWNQIFDVTFVDGRDPAFKLKDGVKDAAPEIGLVFTYDAENGLAIDYEAAETAIREALVEKLANVELDKISVQYKSAGQAVDLNYKPSTVLGKAFGEGDFEIVLTWVGDKDYRSFSETVNVKMIDNRIASEINVVSNPSITYNKDGSAEKAAIIANVIDLNSSKLPADAKFTVECKGGITGNAWKDITENTMDAGENQEIRISFAGNAEYKPCTLETTITVKKAPVSITLPIISKLYAGEEIKIDDYCTVTPKDPAIDVYLFFVGVNSNGEGCVNFQLTDDQMAIIDNLSKIQMKVFGVAENDTIKAKLRTGMKLSEFKETIEKLPDIDNIEFVNNILTILSTMDTITDNTIIAIGTPAHAGVYQATAVSFESKNYEAGKGTGSLVILKNWKNIKLEKNPVLNSGDKANTITVSQAEELKAGNNLCILTKDGEPLNSASAGSIHYWFTGVNRIHVGSKMPTTPGKYIVTASVRGGDFFALPKTFSFTIVNDPAPEA